MNQHDDAQAAETENVMEMNVVYQLDEQEDQASRKSKAFTKATCARTNRKSATSCASTTSLISRNW